MPTALATTTGSTTGGYVNDCYGTLTQTAGTAIMRLVPPREGARARVAGFSYTAAATAHTLTFLVVEGTTTVASDAASGQQVVNFSSLPVTSDGTLIAANDFVALQYEDGSWAHHAVSSLSGNAVTMGANLTQKVKAGTTVFFFGAAADHSSRQFTMAASTTFTFQGDGLLTCFATARADGQPILVHSDNGTNAGTLRYLNYSYGSP